MKKEIPKINIFKKCRNKLEELVRKLAHKLIEKELEKTSELVAEYPEEIKEYLSECLKDNPQTLPNEIHIEILPLGTSIEDHGIPNLTGNEKVLLIELSVFKPTIKLEYANILWQVRFNFVYLTEQVKVTSAKDKFEKYMDQVDILVPILLPLRGKKMKHGEMKKDDIELISIRTIPKSNSSKELKSTIYKGNARLDRRYRRFWKAFARFVEKSPIRLVKFVLFFLL